MFAKKKRKGIFVMGNIRRIVQTLAERGNPRRGRYLKRSEVLGFSVRSSQPNNKFAHP